MRPQTMFRFWLLGIAFAPACASAAETTGAAERTFHMGFTPFPYDLSTSAIAGVKRILHQHADLVSVHFEGVPWREAHTGEPFHAKVLEDWNRQRDARPPGGKLFLSLSPLNNGRNGIAGYRAAEENLPLPEPLAGKALDDPAVLRAYLEFCRSAIRFFEPDTMAIGIEVNELFHHRRAQWGAYTNLHTQTYVALQREHPRLPLCFTFTLHNLLNPDWKDRDDMLAATKALMDHSDRVAVSFYPFMALLDGKMDESLDWLHREFGRLGKPYLFSETGQPAEPVVLKSLNFTIPTDPQRQRWVLARLLEFARERRAESIVWFLPRDYDQLWERIRPTAPEFFGAWRDCGLFDGTGNPRPAFELWQSVFTPGVSQ
jgi:hypothetical protein